MDRADRADEGATQGLHRPRAAAAPDAAEVGAGAGLWDASSSTEAAAGATLARDLLDGTAACCAGVAPLLIETLGLQTVTVTLAAIFGLLALLALLAVAAGLAGGITLSRRLSRARGATKSREQRFRTLLALAVDGYWEIDAAYRLTAAADQTGRPLPLNTARGLGVVPWLLQRWHSEADALDRLLAQLDGRQPFRDIAFCRTDRRGRVRHYRASGEPRFNRAGLFTGYWGILRDITLELAAQSALAATETRYRELFSHTPTPLVLHRNAVVIDANAAALALLGQLDLRSLVGSDLLAF